MHVGHGVLEADVKTAVVVHAAGWPALLTTAACATLCGGKPNPSRVLVEEARRRGATMVLCSQTAGARSIRRDELQTGAQVTISARTAVNVLQADGFRFNPWCVTPRTRHAAHLCILARSPREARHFSAIS